MRLLLIEDEPEIAVHITRGLERARYAVDTVDDGQLGLYNASVNSYDLILCDYMLPNRDGISLAKELRSRDIHTPMLMLTVVDDLGTKIKALDAGVDDFLCKPFSFEELLARVRAIMRRGEQFQKDVLRCDNLALDVKAHVAERDGKQLKLTRKEFMLLEFLLRKKDQAVSRADLLEHVWDSAADPMTNSIEVHIRYLRRKVDEPFASSPKLIHTVHGVGYKISAL